MKLTSITQTLKRPLSLALTLCMVLILLPAAGAANGTYEIDLSEIAINWLTGESSFSSTWEYDGDYTFIIKEIINITGAATVTAGKGLTINLPSASPSPAVDWDASVEGDTTDELIYFNDTSGIGTLSISGCSIVNGDGTALKVESSSKAIVTITDEVEIIGDTAIDILAKDEASVSICGIDTDVKITGDIIVESTDTWGMATGFYASDGAIVTVEGAISVTGDFAFGLSARRPYWVLEPEDPDETVVAVTGNISATGSSLATGVEAGVNSNVEVTGNITVDSDEGATGLEAIYGAKIMVDGGITVNSIDGAAVGVDARDDTEVTVDGNITVGSDENAIGVKAAGDATVTVKGDITLTGEDNIGVKADLGAKVFVDGSITVPDGGVYIQINGEDFDEGDNVLPSDEPGYLMYTYEDSYVYVAGDEADYVCEIVGGDKYETLAEALDEVEDGDTIKLLETIDYDDRILIDMTITFDLNGKTLNVEAEEDALEVDGGEVKLTGSGAFNVTATTGWAGVYARSNGKATVTNATGVYFGVDANKGEVKVLGNVNSDDIGVNAENSSKVTIDGKIFADGAYIVLNSVPLEEEDGVPSVSKPGYLEYTDGNSTVWVKNTVVEPVASAPEPPAPATVTGAGYGGRDASKKKDIVAAWNSRTGTATMALDAAQIKALIADALAYAEEHGEDPVVTLDFSGTRSVKAAVLNTEAAQAFAEAGASVILKLPNAEVILPPEALAAAGKAPLKVEAAIVPVNALSGLQAAQVKGYGPVVNIDVYAGDAKIDVPLTVSLPYTLKRGEDPKAVCVWHLDELGNLTRLDAEYDPDTGMITFTVGHQSYFVAGYDPVALWKNIFGDVDANAWYYDAVAYANYYGYIHGDGANYKPDGNLSRAMFATLVWKLEGSPLPAGTASFTDVPDGTWYTDAVLWAAEKSIVQGVGDNQYNPGKPLSRQEMVTLLYNYAVYKQYIIPVYQETAYSDTDSIGAWAEGAAQQLADAGVLNGFIGDAFSPAQTATRAEAAQLFKDFLRLIVGK